jgi:hypothetical protein
MTGYACGDATRFRVTDRRVLEREEEALADEARSGAMKAANAAAGGLRIVPQSTLRTVYERTVEGRVGICTTFAYAAAHVLTGGVRNPGGVRVEVVAAARGMGTHVFVVVGRAVGSDLGDRSTWGGEAVIVDLWLGSLKQQWAYHPVSLAPGWLFTRNQVFYDSWGPEPLPEDNAGRSDAGSIEAALATRRQEQERERKEKERPSWVRRATGEDP